MKKCDCLAMFLLIVGAINWGLLAVFDFNLVDYVFGRVWIARVLYFLVGVSGVYVALTWKGVKSRMCAKK
jgi:uncharacterized protein